MASFSYAWSAGTDSVGQATQVAVRTAQTTARAAGRALSQIELNPAALTQFNNGIPLNLLRWKQTGNPLAKIAEGFGTAAERAAPVRTVNGKSLLPGEGAVGTYDDLIAAGAKGDNITPHHIPSANHMKQHGVSKGDGISINMASQ